MTLPRILNRLVSRLLAAETRAIRLRPDLGWQLALPPGAASGMGLLRTSGNPA